VPEISRFYGIVIEMRRNEHGRPHFHARCGRLTISVAIADGQIIGRFPKRKLRLVRRWLELHRAELLDDWGLLQRDQPPRYIEPLC
jgi:hypothetical protein